MDTAMKHSPQKQFIFGLHAVQEAWQNPDRDVMSLFVSEKVLQSFPLDAPVKRPKPQIVDRKFLDKKLKGAVHQGIALEVEPLEEIFAQDLIIRAMHKDKSVLLVLDQVTDPHNVGAIMRSACVFGADGLIMQRRHSPMVEGVLAKTASGAAEHLPVAYEVNLNKTIIALKDAGYVVLGLDERGERSISGLDKMDKVALVLGAEGSGLRPSIKENCSELVKLPTAGPISSLNVSNAAAVGLYALCS